MHVNNFLIFNNFPLLDGLWLNYIQSLEQAVEKDAISLS